MSRQPLYTGVLSAGLGVFEVVRFGSRGDALRWFRARKRAAAWYESIELRETRVIRVHCELPSLLDAQVAGRTHDS